MTQELLTSNLYILTICFVVGEQQHQNAVIYLDKAVRNNTDFFELAFYLLERGTKLCEHWQCDLIIENKGMG